MRRLSGLSASSDIRRYGKGYADSVCGDTIRWYAYETRMLPEGCMIVSIEADTPGVNVYGIGLKDAWAS